MWGSKVISTEKPIHVDIYTRSDCERTRDVHQVLNDIGHKYAIQVRLIDISHDVTLEIAYGKDTPVVIIDGAERFRKSVNEHELRIILQTIAMRKMQESRKNKGT